MRVSPPWLVVLLLVGLASRASRADDYSALTDAYAGRTAIRSALEQIFVQAERDLPATVRQLEARGFICTRPRARPQHDVWCSYRDTLNLDPRLKLPPVPFRREIGVSVDGGMLRASFGYILTDPHADDEDVRSELERLYNGHAQADVRELVGLLENEGYACSAPAVLQNFNHYCDFRAPFPVVLQDGMRFMFEFRRQILFAATDSGLRIRIGSHVTGL